MKRLLLSTGMMMLLLMSTTSCNKLRETLFPGIDVNLPAFQFTVPAISFVLPNEASLGSFTMHFNLDSIIRANTANAFGAGAVASVKVKEVVITIPNADQQNNLANFESSRFTFSSNTNSAHVEILSVNFPDVYAATTTVTPTNSPELKSYLTGTQLTYTLFGKARRTTSKPLNFTVQVSLTTK